ncbi:hypothetical protein A1O3_00350 [Capronia epimyces CBS 606.96]|uniref:Uncharacterized protein n=1 Tax=Capronia epimyces CBS 606.96 TaxID=1182542 RepID=W9YQ51_9EURO|nr:uncharacterized protein A1O3_00350 [Capronia epimyces CBS 606.96]EXJ91800.1 hypothetical protein A1O3_00350 [Capronia epimyces CBS 606.96]
MENPPLKPDVGLEHILQWLRGVSGHIKPEGSPDLDFGYSPILGTQLGEKSLALLSSNLRPAIFTIPLDKTDSLLRANDSKDSANFQSQKRKRSLSSITIPPRLAPSAAPQYKPSSSNHVSSSEDAATSRSSSFTSAPVHSTYAQCSPDMDPGSRPVFPLAPSPLRLAPHVSLPLIELDNDPMACAIVSYLDLARSMISQGTPILEVFGPERPIVDLLFRSRKENDAHSVCHFACELISGLEGMDFAAKLGLAFMFVHLIRWIILCSTANYARIPELYRPTAAQTTIPHSAAVEFCPFRQLRDALCRQHREFLPALASNISCNWPYRVDTCVQPHDDSPHLVLTDSFCRHIQDPENWTVRDDIFDTFPECKGLIKTTL